MLLLKKVNPIILKELLSEILKLKCLKLYYSNKPKA
jgi:hypothetical protein